MDAIADNLVEQPAAPADHARRIEELGQIIMAYSEITERLQESHDQLRETVQTLRQELSEKNRLLERKNRLAALGEMAAGLAHEIRNPLGGIQLYASMLGKDLAGQTIPLETVRKISSGVKRLEALVGQVLHFSREITANPAPCDLAEIVSNAIELATPVMQSAKVQYVMIAPASLPANVDSLLVGQAVLNLVMNAAEAMAEQGGGRIEVELRSPVGEPSDYRQFQLVVRDTGPGIPAGILDRIFNPFFTTKDTGTGLGLSIVHRIVEAHDGTIVARNDERGGARFELRV